MNILRICIVFFIIFPLSLSAEKKTKLGLIIPLSGPLAEYGIAIENGIKLALEDNPSLTNTINIKYEDSRYDTKTAVALFKKFANEKVDLIYAWGGPTSEAVAPLAKQLKIPTIAWSADPALCKNNDYLIRIVNPPRDFGCVLNKYFLKNNYYRLGVIKVENQYINTMLDGLRECLDPKQSLEILDSFTPSENNFNTTVARMKSKKIDALGVYLFSGQASLFYKQLEKNQHFLPTFGTDFFESLSEVKQAGPAMDKAVFSNHTTSEKFRQRYIKTFKNDYQIPNAGLGYDLVNIVYKISKSNKKDLNHELRQIKDYPGMSGNINFVKESNQDAYFQLPIVLRQVLNQKIVTVE